jgi:hypothetical protein
MVEHKEQDASRLHEKHVINLRKKQKMKKEDLYNMLDENATLSRAKGTGLDTPQAILKH